MDMIWSIGTYDVDDDDEYTDGWYKLSQVIVTTNFINN